MTNLLFKRTILISLLAHLILFNIFSLSFGNRIPRRDFVSVSFWGQSLSDYQLIPTVYKEKITQNFFARKSDTLVLDKTNRQLPLPDRYYLRPPLALQFFTEKKILTEKLISRLLCAKRKEPVIIFHPLLPYSFTLYFKDRQIAHVELMFNIVSTGRRSSVAVKRKISSGNLEVDLLVMRYIKHYLFIQQAKFSSPSWQTVKIDLSAKND